MAVSRPGFVVSCVVLTASLHATPAAAQATPSLDALRQRLAAYLTEYQEQLSSVVATEHYFQEYSSTSLGRRLSSGRRQLTSEFLFLRLPDYDDWVALRDVRMVDGREVQADSQRLVERLVPATDAALAEAKRISDANARFNIGETPRTVNVPTVALNLLAPRNHARLRFQRPVEETFDNQPAWRIDFTETARPTTIRTREGENQPARGAVWLARDSGAIVGTRLLLGGDTRGVDVVVTTIQVTYTMEPSLGFPVPVTMTESYYRPSQGDAYTYRISARATYSDFKRFQAGGRLVP